MSGSGADTAGRGVRFDPGSVTRPAPELLTYYLWVSALTLLGFPFVFAAKYLRYVSLRYRFDDEGVCVAWGVLFKREVHLTYRRIQDIHVTRNLFHRWLGLATIAVQTASGAPGAEVDIEGVRDPEALRDFLYTKMRGARGEAETGEGLTPESRPDDEALALLKEIAASARQLAHRGGGAA